MSEELAKKANLYSQVGQRMRERRKQLNISQGRLAEMLGISYQQVQKYETGQNQLALGRMLQFSSILNVSPDYFYEGLNPDEIGIGIETDVIQRERSRPLRVLLVEDSPADALLFQKMIQPIEQDIQLHCISESDTVMQYLYQSEQAAQSPDLIILDLNLPKLNGLQLLKAIKSTAQTQVLPTLILTNSISKREMQEAYRLGCAGFIQKSLDLATYKESVLGTVHYWSKIVALPQA